MRPPHPFCPQPVQSRILSEYQNFIHNIYYFILFQFYPIALLHKKEFNIIIKMVFIARAIKTKGGISMKKACILFVVFLLVLGCCSCDRAGGGGMTSSEPPVEITPPGSTPQWMDLTLRELVAISPVTVTAKVTKMERVSKARKLYFERTSILVGETPASFVVTDYYLNASQFGMNDSGYGDVYEVGKEYILVLESYASPYNEPENDYVQYMFAEKLYLPLDSGGNILWGRKLGKLLKGFDPAPESAVTTLAGFRDFALQAESTITPAQQQEMQQLAGQPFTRSADLNQIVAEADILVKVMLGSPQDPYNDRPTYYGTVLETRKGTVEGDEIPIILRPDQVTAGQTYWIALAERTSSFYRLSAVYGVIPLEREAEVEAALSQLSAT